MSNNKLPEIDPSAQTQVIQPEAATQQRIPVTEVLDATSKVKLPKSIESLRDTVDVNKETPDLLPALLLDQEDSAEAWPELSLARPSTETPTPPIITAPNIPEAQANTVPLPLQAITTKIQERQENIPTSMIPARVPREAIPTKVIPARREPAPPKSPSRLPWLGAVALGLTALVFWLGQAPLPQKTALPAPLMSAPKEPPPAPAPAASLHPAQAPETTFPENGKTTSKITLSLSSSPKGASAILNGKDLGRTPLSVALEPSDETVTLVITKEGFLPVQQSLTLTESYTATAVLEKRRESKETTIKTPFAEKPIEKPIVEKSAEKTSKPTKPGKNDLPNPFK